VQIHAEQKGMQRQNKIVGHDEANGQVSLGKQAHTEK
jgi:hypothetical protein